MTRFKLEQKVCGRLKISAQEIAEIASLQKYNMILWFVLYVQSYYLYVSGSSSFSELYSFNIFQFLSLGFF